MTSGVKLSLQQRQEIAIGRGVELIEYNKDPAKSKFKDKEFGIFLMRWKNFYYGNQDHPLRVKAKREATNLKLYGVKNSGGTIESLTKARATSKKRYGVEHPQALKVFKDRAKATMLLRYGVDNPLKSATIASKARQTIRLRYGVDNIAHIPGAQDKRKKTCKERYGHEQVLQSPLVQVKISQTNLTKYGHKRPQLAKALWVYDELRASGKLLVSKTENEIRKWVEHLTGESWPSVRLLENGGELDMYCDKKKFAIEYCGLHWHNEQSPNPRGRNYHSNKLRESNALGIRLITIFEDEWISRKDQVKGYLKSALGLNKTKLNARSLTVKKISKKEAFAFLNQNHIQGAACGSVLFFALITSSNEIVSCMSFGRHPRQGHNNVSVLDRYSVLNGVSIRGGASKLFAAARKEIVGKIISWSDNRWSNGNLYVTLGFKCEAELPPDYSYVDDSKRSKAVRLSKQSQRKSKTGCPDGMTEVEFATSRKLYRIWDCGKKRWVLMSNTSEA